MANSRQIFKCIYHSRNFLKLPADTRDFYTFMTLESDDDGIVDVYSLAGMLRIQNYEVHIKLLLVAGFIFELSREEEIYYIERFQELNKIKAIYKVNSPHLALLEAMRPDVPITMSSKERKNILIEEKKLPGGPEI